MPRSKLAQMLLEDQAAKTEDGSSSSLSSFGLEHLTDISKFLKERIQRWRPSVSDYDPLFEIAKLALTTDSHQLAFRCHSELARYTYPQIRSLEVQAQKDNEVKIKIEMAGYAAGIQQSIDSEVIEVEDIETEGDIDAEETPDKKEELEKKHLKEHPAGAEEESEKRSNIRQPEAFLSDKPRTREPNVGKKPDPKKTGKALDYLDMVVTQSQKPGRNL